MLAAEAMLTLGASVVLVALATGAQNRSLPDNLPVADVVVMARPGAPPPLLDAVGYFRRHCFEPARLKGVPSAPEDDLEWTPLDQETRRKLGVADPDVPASGLRDAARGHTLLLKVERLPLSRSWRTVEDRCTLVVIGGRNHQAMLSGMAALWRASGTQRNLDGTPTQGWRQWHWSGMPARDTKAWRALTRGRGSESTALRVVDPAFYTRHDYIMGDLKTREGTGTPISVLSFVRVHRPDELRARR